jgi:aminoglycoside phosphotransferase (APT) family kinase protein
VSSLTGQVLSWAAAAVAPGTRVVEVKGLRQDANPWLVRLDRAGNASEVVLRVGDSSSHRQRQQFATEVAALAVAEEHGLGAPRLIAVDADGSAAGAMAVLTTVLPGSSTVPRVVSAGRLLELGAAAARLHAVSLAPRAGLPLRHRSLSDVDFASWRRSTGTAEVLLQAEERLAEFTVPDDDTVLVHGDLWWGNTMWKDGSCTGMVDWDCAGAGSPGIDLGSLRCDAALLFGLPAADQVLAGWQHTAGTQADHVAYWDAVAASCTLADMAYSLPAVHDQGRSDLDTSTLTIRRDAFLQAALDRLDHS